MDTIKHFRFLIPVISIVLIATISLTIFLEKEEKQKTKKIQATILQAENSEVVLLDQKDQIYTFSSFDYDGKLGDTLLIQYTGILNPQKNVQDVEVISYKKAETKKDENGIPIDWKDNGIFSDYYIMANNKLKKLSLDEKIGQLLLVRYPDSNISSLIQNYKPSGLIFFEKDFKNKDVLEVQRMIQNVQNASKIPLLTAVDEEGGNVVRISSNPKLTNQKFESPQALYTSGGFEKIKSDTIKKSKLLHHLGLNLNLAPVVDVSTDPSNYIYPRTIGQNKSITSTYAKTVIEASKNTNVSYTLKHFPGYGNNTDTHSGSSTDNRSYNDILNNDISPFESGIKAGAEAVLFSHNIITSMDPNHPASLSPVVHSLLRNNLKFTGITITDDISMAALNSINDAAIQAILAKNNLIITTDYHQSFTQIKNAIKHGNIDEAIIDQAVFKVLAWKYYKGLMIGK